MSQTTSCAKKYRKSLGVLLISMLVAMLFLQGCNTKEIKAELERMATNVLNEKPGSSTRTSVRNNPLDSEIDDLMKGLEQTVKASVSDSLLAAVSKPDARDNLQTYAREKEYSSRSAVLTAGAVLAANCKHNRNSDDNCLKNVEVVVPAGLAIGAVGGWIVASKQNSYSNDKQAVSSQLEAAQRELAEAKSAGLSAKLLVDSRVSELKEVQKEAAAGRASQKKVSATLAAAKQDENSLRKSITRLRDGNIVLKEQNKQRKGSSPEAAKLNELYITLNRERALLDEQLSLLINAMDFKA